ncbi:hypothetical protein BGY98DRAFT_957975 [Russula aff. rugulosa BPL654]|nr:hypothetical protein BGY98DRAFT_1046095 [Russula aff. rugulosa BPL654]KAI0268466.1 hypothetical protein BGY98DRAFT_1019458 [Russula aff. rugulosa BPL654]KAI0281566.1 hypothetical protein BGY98DRAFT_957975 [Russula aff. rugulosa BPL654]
MRTRFWMFRRATTPIGKHRPTLFWMHSGFIFPTSASVLQVGQSWTFKLSSNA